MKRVLIAAAVALSATAAQADSYFAHADTIACPSLSALLHHNQACTKLPANAAVQWDGKIINDWKQTQSMNVGRVAIAGKTAFVYSNYLGGAPAQDPLQRQFTLARDAMACPTRAAFNDGLEARIARDEKWFGETGCIEVPKGTSTARLRPVAANRDPVWLMRVRFPHSQASELWMEAADFR